jgi:hypothetical protein
MAVHINPGGEQHGESAQLISAGGNIYSIGPSQVKRGTKTLGRGHWAGSSHPDKDNPDVDSPSLYGANVFVPPTEEEDEDFEDNTPPEEAMIRDGHGKNILRHDLKQARQMVEAASGMPMTVGKAILTLGAIKVDLLLEDPEKLSEEQLVKSAATVKAMVEAATGYERTILANHAARIAQALRVTMQAREELSKAILTKPSEEREHKSKKMKPKKASETKVNDKGKVAYKYKKRGDGKGPNSDRGSPASGAQDGQAQPQTQEQPVTPPPPVDPKPFATALGIGAAQLERFASKKDRKTFVSFFMSQKDIVEKHKITPAYIGRLYDSITTPSQPPQQQGAQLMKPPAPQPAPGPNPAMPGAKPTGVGRHQVTPLATKSLVVFTGATLNADTLAMLDMLKSQQAETVGDIAKCLQHHYACTEPESLRHTVSLLNKWERKGLVSLYPAKV